MSAAEREILRFPQANGAQLHVENTRKTLRTCKHFVGLVEVRTA